MQTRVVEAFKSPLDLSFIEPVGKAIKAAPSDRHLWAENLPQEQPKQAARTTGKTRPARKRVARKRIVRRWVKTAPKK